MCDAKQQANCLKNSRQLCKYGAECYQKNPFHRSKYTHPPAKEKNQENTVQHADKKRKIERENKEIPKISNDVSDSEDEDATNTTVAASSVNSRIENAVASENIQMKQVNVDKTDLKEAATDVKLMEDSDNERQKLDSQVNAKEKQKLPEVSNSGGVGELSSVTDPVNCIPSDFDQRKFIKEKFLVDMPPDFYSFWEFCKKINKNDPSLALKEVGLTLVGPFDVLAGKFNNTPEKNPAEYLLHWRYFYDPPEFQTVLKGDDSMGYHIGYFRDSPNERPVFMAYNNAKVDGVFAELGSNVFAAFSLYLDNLKKTGDPFKKMRISKLSSSVKSEAEKLQLDLSLRTESMRKRHGKVVTKTFNKIGLVVPIDKETELGYRELTLPDKELKQLLEKLSKASPEQKDKLMAKLQPVLTYASIATDECDFGTGIELGWNILCSGIESLNLVVSSFLANSYNLLDRHAFALIAEAHMQNRRNGTHLSILQNVL